MLLFISLILGLIVGSFLNAVIFRLHSGKSFVGGRSECMYCKHELHVWDLIPVLSFAWLNGKCRYCGQQLSAQYPIVELLTASVFMLFMYFDGMAFTWTLLRDWFFASVFIVIAVYDLKHFLILDKVLAFALAVGVALNVLVDATTGCSLLSWDCHTLSGLIGAAVASGFFLAQYVFSKGKWIGFGDVKLGLLLGLVVGWPNVIALLFVAYFIGAVVGLGLVLTEQRQMSSKLPFGVFLSISAIIIMIYGNRLIDWYLGLIGY